jgi:hypothetical protein
VFPFTDDFANALPKDFNARNGGLDLAETAMGALTFEQG